MTTTYDVLTVSSIEVGGVTFSRTHDSKLDSGVRKVVFSADSSVFSGASTQLRVLVWPTGATVLDLIEQGEFVYAASRDTTIEAFEMLHGYVAARDQVRKAAAS